MNRRDILRTPALAMGATLGGAGKAATDGLSAKARIIVRRPPSQVFAAFADASAMSKFWFTRRDAGLREGETVTWFLGPGEDAIAFDVRVKKANHPGQLVIEWPGHDGNYTQVAWSFEETVSGYTLLTIEESGFTGSDEAIVERALDSTGGFNQVIVAAKALIEHGVELNVVADHG